MQRRNAPTNLEACIQRGRLFGEGVRDAQQLLRDAQQLLREQRGKARWICQAGKCSTV